MNEAPRAAATKPSTVAITKMLAEAQVARRHGARYTLLLLLAVVLLGAGLMAYAFKEVRDKLRQRDELVADIKEKRRELEELEARRQRLAENNKELAGTVSQITRDVQEAAQTGEGAKALEARVLNTVQATQAIAQAPPRVFIHVTDDGQRQKAAQLAQALKGADFIVPGIEKRPEQIKGNQVKFFRPEDKAVADKVAAILSAQGLPPRLVPVTGTKALPGQLEVWLASDSQPTPDRPLTRPGVLGDRVQQGAQQQGNNRPATRPDNRQTNRPLVINRPAVRPQ